MNEEQRRTIINGHLPWPEKATAALKQFIACFPTDVHVKIDAPVVDVATFGDVTPKGVRAIVTAWTEQRVGRVDKPSYETVDWELGPTGLRPVKIQAEDAL